METLKDAAYLASFVSVGLWNIYVVISISNKDSVFS